MLRYLRPPSLRRTPAFRCSLPLSCRQYVHTVQRVRFVNPIFTTRRLKGIIAFGAAYYAFYEILDLAFEDEDEHQDQPARPSSQSPPNADQPSEIVPTTLKTSGKKGGIPRDKDDVEPLFIPLGWPKQLPQTYYKGSDPEWQSFIAFNRDPKKGVALQRELVRLVGLHALTHDHRLRKTLGHPVKAHRAWLEIDYPDGPPKEYARSGLEFGDDYIAWTTKQVPSRNVSLLKRYLFPTSVFSSFWASWSTLGAIQMAKVRRFFNLETPDLDEENSFSTISPPGGRVPRTVDSRSSSSTAPNQAELPPDPNPLKQDGSKSITTTDDSKHREFKGAIPPRPPLPGLGEEMKEVVGAFKRTLAKTWKQEGELAPRGCFFISGLFEMQGPKATCILETVAVYHPVDRTWASYGYKVRRLRIRHQPPRGGP